eukprot:scaffold195068_cov21-Prasinocladus_malaysianus.AAC.2
MLSNSIDVALSGGPHSSRVGRSTRTVVLAGDQCHPRQRPDSRPLPATGVRRPRDVEERCDGRERPTQTRT